jgi:hypothetical protein
VTEIKFRRLEWLRHVNTMEEMVLYTKPEGKCGVERPKFRWLDDVQAKSSRQKRAEDNSEEG